MPTPLHVTSTLHITPLIDIRSASFATSYSQGVSWCLYGEDANDAPLLDHYIVTNLNAYITKGYFDGKHEHCLPFIGFWLGMIHGGVLTPDGQLRSDVSTLVTCQYQDFVRGYSVGREWYFYDASPRERWQTETDMIERFRELASEYRSFRNYEHVLHYTLGCTLGELSGHLFPETAQETREWEAERQKALAAYYQQQPV